MNKKETLTILVMFTIAFVVTYMIIDFVGFCAWIYSGQAPQSSYYLGSLTQNIISLIIK